MLFQHNLILKKKDVLPKQTYIPGYKESNHRLWQSVEYYIARTNHTSW